MTEHLTRRTLLTGGAATAALLLLPGTPAQATTGLRRIAGPAGLTRYARGPGDPVTRLDRWETELNDWSPSSPRDTTTPGAMARNLRGLTVGHELDPRDRDRLVGWLRATTTGGSRIRAGLPASWTVGDKTGSADANRSAADATYDNTVIASAATLLVSALGRL